MTVSMVVTAAGGLKHSPVHVQLTRFGETGNSQMIVDSLINDVSDLNQADLVLQPEDRFVLSAASKLNLSLELFLVCLVDSLVVRAGNEWQLQFNDDRPVIGKQHVWY